MNQDAAQNPSPHVSSIVAVTSKDAAIGYKGDLVVKISDDLKRFKTLTIGHPIIMGRKTYQSIGRALPKRPNFVVTRDPNLSLADATVCHSIHEAVEQAWQTELASGNDHKEVFLIGGAEIFKQALPLTNKVYLTLVQTDLPGDTFFPEYKEFKKVIRREDRVDEKSGLKYSWIDLER